MVLVATVLRSDENENKEERVEPVENQIHETPSEPLVVDILKKEEISDDLSAVSPPQSSPEQLASSLDQPEAGDEDEGIAEAFSHLGEMIHT